MIYSIIQINNWEKKKVSKNIKPKLVYLKKIININQEYDELFRYTKKLSVSVSYQ